MDAVLRNETVGNETHMAVALSSLLNFCMSAACGPGASSSAAEKATSLALLTALLDVLSGSGPATDGPPRVAVLLENVRYCRPGDVELRVSMLQCVSTIIAVPEVMELMWKHDCAEAFREG